MGFGWIKLPRSLLDSCLMQKSVLLHVYLLLYLRAAFKEQEVLIGSKVVVLQPGQAIFSRAQISRETRISEQTAYRAVRRLERLGFIRITSHSTCSIATILCWQAEQGEQGVVQLESPSEPALQSSSQPEVNSERAASEQPSDTYKKDKPINKSHNQQIKEIFDYWQEVMGKSKAKLTAKRAKAIQARLNEGYTLDEIKRAVQGCKLSAFHMGDNDQRRKFNDIELVCRSGDKLEQFAELTEPSPKVPSRKQKLSLAEQKEKDLEIARQRICSRGGDRLALVKNERFIWR